MRIIIFFLLFPLNVMAYDLGVRGTIYEIKEPNMLAIITLQMQKVDWKKVNKKIAEDQKKKLHNMPYADLKLAKKDRFRLVDPTIVLKANITAPTLDGRTVILGRKGQKLNPLKYAHPRTKMFFFDPSNEDQLKLALDAESKHPNQVYLVAIGGDIAKLADKLNKPIFYAYPWIVEKFQLKSYPVLVGVKGMNIALGEMNTLTLEHFEDVWNEMD